MMAWQYPEPSLEPSEPEVDGVWQCHWCEDVIPGGELCYTIEGLHYCKTCMQSFLDVAPTREEASWC